MSEIRKQVADLGTSTLVPSSVSVRRVVSQSGNRAIAETTVDLAFQFERDSAVSPWHIASVRLRGSELGFGSRIDRGAE